MRINRGLLNWGVFFLCLGGVPLLVQQGVISASAAADLWRLWPVVLVGIGLGVLLSRSPAYFVGGLVVAACVGLALGGLLATGSHLSCGGSGEGNPIADNDTFGGTGTVSLHLICGTAAVATADGNDWSASARNGGGNAPSIEKTGSTLAVRSNSGNGFWLDRGRDTWTITLPQKPELSIDLTLDAADATLDLTRSNLRSLQSTINFGSARLDLTGASARRLDGTVNFASAKISLPSSNLDGSYTVNLGSLDLCIPDDLGVRIRSKETLSGSNLGSQGFTRTGDSDTWVSSGADGKQYQASIEVETNLGSLNVHPSGGCK